MTLNEIIVSALAELDRGYDPQTLDVWRNKFTLYVNDAISDLATSFKLKRTETVRVNGSTIDLRTLDRPCIKLVCVTQDGFLVRASGDASGIVSVRAVGNVDVTYLYMPERVSRPSDVPQLPEYLHSLIVDYVVARERLSGDIATQKGGQVYLQLYEVGKNRLLAATAHEQEILNKW